MNTHARNYKHNVNNVHKQSVINIYNSNIIEEGEVMSLFKSLSNNLIQYEEYYTRKVNVAKNDIIINPLRDELPINLKHTLNPMRSSWGAIVVSTYSSKLKMDAISNDYEKKVSLSLKKEGHYASINSLIEEALITGVSFAAKISDEVLLFKSKDVSLLRDSKGKVLAALIKLPAINIGSIKPSFLLYTAPGFVSLHEDNSFDLNTFISSLYTDVYNARKDVYSARKVSTDMFTMRAEDYDGGSILLLDKVGGCMGAIVSKSGCLVHQPFSPNQQLQTQNTQPFALNQSSQNQSTENNANNAQTDVHNAHNMQTIANNPYINILKNIIYNVDNSDSKWAVYVNNNSYRPEEIARMSAYVNSLTNDSINEYFDVEPFYLENDYIASDKIGRSILNSSFCESIVSAGNIQQLIKSGSILQATSKNLLIAQGLDAMVVDNRTGKKQESFEESNSKELSIPTININSTAGDLRLEKLSAPEIEGLISAFYLELESAAASVHLSPTTLGLHKQQVSSDYLKSLEVTLTNKIASMRENLERSIKNYIKLLASIEGSTFEGLESYIEERSVVFKDSIPQEGIGAFADAIIKIKEAGIDVDSSYVARKLGISEYDKIVNSTE